MRRTLALVAGSLVASAALARTQEIALWRGETQTFRLQDFARLSGEPPKGVSMRRGALREKWWR